MTFTDDDWRGRGACASADPDLFFPLSGSGPSLPQIARAKAVCSGCPVRAQCLAFALDSPQVHGIWGGRDEQELARLRRSRRPGPDGLPLRERIPGTGRVSRGSRAQDGCQPRMAS